MYKADCYQNLKKIALFLYIHNENKLKNNSMHTNNTINKIRINITKYIEIIRRKLNFNETLKNT